MTTKPLVLTLALTATLIQPGSAHADPFSCAPYANATSHKAIGLGSVLSPYRLCTPAQLKSLGDASGDWTKVYALEADLDMYGITTFKPIGTTAKPFTGQLRGNGHQVYHLAIALPATSYVGLFGNLRGSVTDLFLHADVTGSSYVGGLAGAADAGAVISNVHASGGTIQGGGFAGSVGGLVGKLGSATITGSNTFGVTVVGGHSTGGPVGSAGTGASISASYAQDTAVDGAYFTGGLAGLASYATITGSYAAGTVSSSVYAVGGLIGRCLNSTVDSSFAVASVEGRDDATSGERVGLYIGLKECPAVSNGWYSLGEACVNVGGDGECVNDLPGVVGLPPSP